MREIYWGIFTFLMWLIAIGCIVNNHLAASIVFFGIGFITVHFCEKRA